MAAIMQREDFPGRLAGLGGHELAVGVLDLDEFEAVNLTHGRTVGDSVLALVEHTLDSNLPSPALLSRLGGDLWGCALPGASPEELLIILDKIRQHLADSVHDFGAASFPVRFSAGVAAIPHHTNDPARLPALAEEALHRSKTEGRNRVAIYVEDKMVLKSNYYARAQLARLAKLAATSGRTEASLLREALTALLAQHPDS